MNASDSPKEIFEMIKDAMEVNAFRMAELFTKRLRELMHTATDPKEINEIAGMLAEIRSM